MGKPALGKGMKDLLVKNFGLVGEKESTTDAEKALKELKVNIDRFHAQGFNTDLLRELEGKGPKEILKGIESYRASVKSLNSAQTILRSLEGYGYSDEIDSITEMIKDPSRTGEVLEKVEELKQRIQVEHNLTIGGREKPRDKLTKSLEEKSKKLRNADISEKDVEGMDIDEEALDGLLDDLEDIEEAFGDTEGEDPLLSKISEWEDMGYFVDNLKTSISEDRKRGEKEASQFEKDVARMEEVKRRFSEMDLSAFQEEAQEILLRFQYPHLAGEVNNELDSIEMRIKEAERLVDEAASEEEKKAETAEEEKPKASQVPEDVKETGEVTGPEEEVPAPDREAQSESESEREPPSDAEAPEEVETAGAVEGEEGEKEPPEGVSERKKASGKETEEAGPAEKTVEGPGPYSKYSPEELLDMAKEAYKEGRMEEALTLFKEILRKDPESSKARFMIRRISQKL